ncbi:MAG: hypothetical protein FWC36_07910 [Spirochaetes bacterium]|nr:hypothetical protein [Spirochaetota bacterium]
MDFLEEKKEYYKIIAPIVNSYGFEIVELNSKSRADGLYINIVLYSPSGISLNDCSKVHKAVQGRIEVHTGSRDVYIEVSSPGVNRNLKSANEFNVFKGKTIKLIFGNNTEWSYYIIKDADRENVLLEPINKNSNHSQSGNEVKLQYSEIRKAKLES